MVQVGWDLRRSQFELRPRWLRVLSVRVLKNPKDGERLHSLCGQFLPRLNHPHEEKYYPVQTSLVATYIHCVSSAHRVPLWRSWSAFLRSPVDAGGLLFGPLKSICSRLNKPISQLSRQPCAEPDPVYRRVAVYWVTKAGHSALAVLEGGLSRGG